MSVVYRDRVQFDSVVVWESLPRGEKKTGTWLYDNVLKPWADNNPPFEVLFNSLNSRNDFFAALAAAEEQLLDKGRLPIVHIEAHGLPEGIVLASNELVLWEELRNHLTRMNAKSRFNLFLVMAMCSGWHLSRALHPLYPAPAWGVLGPTEPVWDTDLRDAMAIFYREVLTSFNAWQALQLVNATKPSTAWEYRLETAEVMLCRVIDHYIKTIVPLTSYRIAKTRL